MIGLDWSVVITITMQGSRCAAWLGTAAMCYVAEPPPGCSSADGRMMFVTDRHRNCNTLLATTPTVASVSLHP